MSKPQWVLALVALAVGAVHSWDLAVTVGDHLLLYTNGTKTHIESDQFRTATALAYDAVHDTLFFITKQADNASIHSFEISTNKSQSLVTGKDIGGFAIDPVRELLYWTDIADRSIYWVSYKRGYKEETVNRKLFVKMENEIPGAIAVDICKGDVYWTNTNLTKPTIERAAFNGSDREVLIDKDIQNPVSLAIDQQTKKIFWADNREQKKYKIFSTDFNGKNRSDLISGLSGAHIQPNTLTVSKDLMYLIDRGTVAVYSHSKYQIKDSLKTIDSYDKVPSGIVAKYTTEEQIQGIHECEAVTSLLQNSLDFGPFCVNGKKASDTSLCKCTPGYIGERCDVSVCQNYCIQGNCRVSDEGEPYCGCHPGYSGARCEVNMCLNYCLNNGVCFVTEENEPACQCVENYNGSRCDAVKNATCTVSVKYNSGNKNLTLVELLSNQRKVAGEITVNFELESK